ncbi:phage tail assembly chaperone [Cupriavidus sp. D384]|uniref:phage tail assembly chaperone n=1 Tax=Cupriavidus sp. D384 TaxID=1538095 RepID=UPI0008366FD9|nr:phage tail assembly chaperone [Cupriavidus sp. D384]
MSDEFREVPAPFKLVAAFDPQTGEYAGPVKAYRSPRDGMYPMPANTIDSFPEHDAPQKFAWRVCGDKSAWELVPDNRTVVVLDKATALPIAPLAFGEPIPASATTQPLPEIGEFEAVQWGGEGWMLVPDFSSSTVYEKGTGIRAHPPIIGAELPEHLTLCPPPACGEGAAPRWCDNTDGWQRVRDLRGQRYWLADGSEHVIEGIGEEPPKDAVVEEPPPTNEALATGARWKRDALLRRSDGVVIRALELGESVPAAWSAYRKALRDLPACAGWPSAINWPEPPIG